MSDSFAESCAADEAFREIKPSVRRRNPNLRRKDKWPAMSGSQPLRQVASLSAAPVQAAEQVTDRREEEAAEQLQRVHSINPRAQWDEQDGYHAEQARDMNRCMIPIT